jgi:glucokinase
MPVARRLQQATGLPVVVESDRNASVLGEAWRGAARGAADAIYLIVGTGIGAGILSDGRLVRGAHELSGCAGWMVFDAEGRCRSLEQMAAGPAVGAAGSLALKKPNLTAREVLAAARRGYPAAREVVERAASLLGLAVANLISLFDPEVIVLGGGLGASGETLLGPLRRAALRWAQPLSAGQVRITASRLGARAPLLGAARLALDLCETGDPQAAMRNRKPED